MDTIRFARIEMLFQSAVDLPEAARSAYLRAHESDQDLIGQVERMLSRSAGEQTGLQAALSAAVAATGSVNPQIGPYRILSELGAGGMGAVFLAERLLGDTPQRVALKLIRGVPTSASRERLARERALLAELNHPNIARLIDAGETAEHVPYLAMEYVEGSLLLDYCKQHALGIPARLRLFAQICRAVQHAHQHLIVHRDIKPSNILVRSDGTPVLLDFGIGKLLDPTHADQTATQVFTPAYAAPEQRSGHGLTTATDVYGLGCVLYEMLSGASLPQVRIGEHVPLPSVAATGNPPLARALRGELDTLIGKAMHKEPERRYASAQALAEDVENHVAGKPLRAAPDSVGYRVHKFIQRHRVGVALAVLMAAGILAALGLMLWQRNVARSEADRANAMRDFMFTAFEQAEPSVPRAGPPNIAEVVEQAIDKARKDRQMNNAVRIELITQLGGVLRRQGSAEKARDMLRWNYDTARAELGDGAPNTLKAGHELFKTLEAVGDNAGARALVDALLDQARASQDQMLGALLLDSSSVATKQHQLDRAQADGQLGLRLVRADGDPADLRWALSEFGNLQLSLGDVEGAVSTYEELLGLNERLYGPDHVLVATAHSNLSRAYRRTGNIDAAESHIRAALAIDSSILGKNDWRHALHLNALTMVLVARRDYPAALDATNEALRIDRANQNATESAVELSHVGSIEMQLEDYASAVAPLHEALELNEAKFGAEHGKTASVRADFGVALACAGDIPSGEAELRHAIASLQAENKPDADELAGVYEKWARVRLERGDAAAALPLLDQMDVMVARLGKSSSDWSERAATLRAGALLQTGKPDEALTLLRQATAALAKSRSPDAALRAEAMLLHAQAALRLGNADAPALTTQGKATLAELRAAPSRLVKLADSLTVR